MSNDPQHNLEENMKPVPALDTNTAFLPTRETAAPTSEQLQTTGTEKTIEFGEQLPAPAEKEKEGFLEETIEGLKNKLRGQKKKPTQIPQIKDALMVEVEHIMEDGLKDAFRELTPMQREKFKIKGEETAWEIRGLLRAAHVQVKKIFKLLLEWLKMLPGINRFFLEQEAKIKTDKILALKEKDDR